MTTIQFSRAQMKHLRPYLEALQEDGHEFQSTAQSLTSSSDSWDLLLGLLFDDIRGGTYSFNRATEKAVIGAAERIQLALVNAAVGQEVS